MHTKTFNTVFKNGFNPVLGSALYLKNDIENNKKYLAITKIFYEILGYQIYITR